MANRWHPYSAQWRHPKHREKAVTREQLARDVAEYLANGGKITVGPPPGESSGKGANHSLRW